MWRVYRHVPVWVRQRNERLATTAQTIREEKEGGMTTFCSQCEHKGQDSKSDPWWRWWCRKAPYEVGEQFVTQEPWLNGPPFKLCRWINRDGVCPDWAEKKERDDGDVHAPEGR